VTVLSTQRESYVYFCEDYGFSGDCLSLAVDTSCQNVPDGWNDRISAFRPDESSGGCFLYEYVNFPVTTERLTT
jgi:hypothetical protein